MAGKKTKRAKKTKREPCDIVEAQRVAMVDEVRDAIDELLKLGHDLERESLDEVICHVMSRLEELPA